MNKNLLSKNIVNANASNNVVLTAKTSFFGKFSAFSVKNFTKKILTTLIMAVMLLGGNYNAKAQTVLISPTGDGGFETGTSLPLNNWTVVNAATNTWQVSGLAVPSAGSRSAFISNNTGTSYAYTINTSQTSHFYRDVTVPAGETSIQISFKFKQTGENGYDRLLVYTAPTSVTPVANAPASALTAIFLQTMNSASSLNDSKISN